jgi:hypothetical protein
MRHDDLFPKVKKKIAKLQKKLISGTSLDISKAVLIAI